MPSDPKKLLQKHEQLNQLDMIKVKSHVQRADGEFFVNTIMLDGYDVPFKYKRQQKYKSLQGQRVNLTYYAHHELVAGMEFEVMNVVRIKIA
ncbi:MAG: hypothetical protein OEZ58_08870 [Gammaproteobacteria bacterium]|nr:hypothetical protein [Gammaproteobacteria bacterium]MDH5729089.1 hypothetical protein [Gammaproteobacteria bacterium]